MLKKITKLEEIDVFIFGKTITLFNANNGQFSEIDRHDLGGSP